MDRNPPYLFELAMEELPKTPEGEAWLDDQVRSLERCEAHGWFWSITFIFSTLGFIAFLLRAPEEGYIFPEEGLVSYLPPCLFAAMILSFVWNR
ncbi:hypothetical protein B0T20DRAFT_480442 [Sordaria brevicollis]|uniref:Uncharacterized protein n=1 Tax=Sordaria brevicollis TaxID=83679 RepID=A0AAE0UAB4_SORBR|nr:hypothetical protein B0T20DRAFT_480442 [Sordaria brevicollis]